jgi:prepilin-type N-terminal cleavage/methylation domain-containing protein
MTKLDHRNGFTLIEVIIAVSVVALMMAILIPAVNFARENRENALVASKLQTAVEAFELYASEVGSYPADVGPGVIPPEMQNYYFPYFKINWWTLTTEVGGNWDWDVGYHGIDFSVSICAPTRSQGQMEALDRAIDDGNLNTGTFRKVDDQYHYIIED